MMSQTIPESDRRTFRALREIALERFCKRVLEELEALPQDSSQSYHERYLDVFQLLQKRDEELVYAFNNPRRSTMIARLAAIHAYGLLELHELARFTSVTRDTIESLAKNLAE